MRERSDEDVITLHEKMKDFERWLSEAALNPRRPHLDRLGLVLDSTLVYRGLGPAWICPDLGLFLDIFVMAPYNYHSHKARIVLSVHIFLRNTMKFKKYHEAATRNFPLKLTLDAPAFIRPPMVNI